jgi:hypothetical protein
LITGRAAERGDSVETEKLWREVLAECPGDHEALAKLNGLHGVKPDLPEKAAGSVPDSVTALDRRWAGKGESD